MKKRPMMLNISEICSFSRGDLENGTAIRMKSGIVVNVEEPYLEIKKILGLA